MQTYKNFKLSIVLAIMCAICHGFAFIMRGISDIHEVTMNCVIGTAFLTTSLMNIGW